MVGLWRSFCFGESFLGLEDFSGFREFKLEGLRGVGTDVVELVEDILIQILKVVQNC